MTNPQTEDGYVRLATEIVDQLAQLHISGNEWMILWVVLRKTYGWQKREDAISLTQFQKLTGLSRPSVSEAVTKLVGKRVLVAKKEPYINIYAFNKLYSQWVVPKKELVGFSVKTSRVFGVKLVPKKEHTIDTTKDNTIDRGLDKKMLTPFEIYKVAVDCRIWIVEVVKKYAAIREMIKTGEFADRYPYKHSLEGTLRDWLQYDVERHKVDVQDPLMIEAMRTYDPKKPHFYKYFKKYLPEMYVK